MNSIIFITLALSVYDKTYQNDQNWIQYKENFDKTYQDNNEELKRYNIFKEKDQMMEIHNEKYMLGEVTYKMGHNQFSDMNEEELAEMFSTQSLFFEDNFPQDFDLNISTIEAPASLSYKKHCLPPLSQGKCGSCFAFAATAQIEAQRHLKHGISSYLSPQYILDCSGAGSCGGGYSSKAIAYMKKNGGVLLSNYPYSGVQHQCNRKPKRFGLGIKNAYNIRVNGNEENLKNYLFKYGPVVISIKVINSFYNYRSGVYYDSSCPSNCASTNHAVLVVGYGRDKDDYWLVKNSWGTTWGDSGYIKMMRNRKNNCNVACFARFGVI